MPKTFNLRKTDIARKNVVLNYLELFYLRLYAHGLKNNEIRAFLEIDQNKIQQIRNEITSKYETKDWVKICSIAFKNDVLNKRDYIDPLVKDIALNQTQNIYENYILSAALIFSITELRHLILEFYYKCEIKLSNEYDKRNRVRKLSENELYYLKLKYKGINSKSIFERLNVRSSDHGLRDIKCMVFRKLNVNNWYNAYKRALQFNLLASPENYIESLEAEVVICTNKIVRIRNLKRLLNTEKKLSIYNELLELYANLEFSKLKTNE